jgi:hypothetical protein
MQASSGFRNGRVLFRRTDPSSKLHFSFSYSLRALAVRVQGNEISLTVCSFHIPPGASYTEGAKPPLRWSRNNIAVRLKSRDQGRFEGSSHTLTFKRTCDFKIVTFTLQEVIECLIVAAGEMRRCSGTGFPIPDIVDFAPCIAVQVHIVASRLIYSRVIFRGHNCPVLFGGNGTLLEVELS